MSQGHAGRRPPGPSAAPTTLSRAGLPRCKGQPQGEKSAAAEKRPAGPEVGLRAGTQGMHGGAEEGGSAPRSRGPSDHRCAGQGVWKAPHPGVAGGGRNRQVYPGPAVRVQKMDRKLAVSLGRVNGRKDKVDSVVWRK